MFNFEEKVIKQLTEEKNEDIPNDVLNTNSSGELDKKFGIVKMKQELMKTEIDELAKEEADVIKKESEEKLEKIL